MLLRSMRVTEKILAVAQLKKEQFCGKSSKKTFTQAHKDWTKQLRQSYKYGR